MVPRALLALAFVPALAAAQDASGLPTEVGACVETTIAELGGRLQGDAAFESGTGILYANGGMGVSYDRVEAVVASRVGDPVRLCLTQVPEDCPPDDQRGRVYDAENLRTGGTWSLPDAEHMCGGA